MKTLLLSASTAALMLTVGAVPASAKSASQEQTASQCTWQSPQQFGPRAPLRAPVCTKAGEKAFTGMGGPICDPSYTGTTGHYVWRPRAQFGPRAPLQAPERVWIEAC